MARTIAKDHDQKRGQILKSAAKVFAEQGFDRASMTQLARECGTSKANIYHYYDSKDAILFDILDCYLSELRDRICGLDLGGRRSDIETGELALDDRRPAVMEEGRRSDHQQQDVDQRSCQAADGQGPPGEEQPVEPADDRDQHDHKIQQIVERFRGWVAADGCEVRQEEDPDSQQAVASDQGIPLVA